jgi:hypothetical protein
MTMTQHSQALAVLTAAFLLSGPISLGCGGRLTTGGEATGGSSGSAGTGDVGGTGGSGGSTGGSVGAGGSTVGGGGGSGGSTGGSGGSTGGSGGSTGGSGAAAGSGGRAGGSPSITCGRSTCSPIVSSPVGTLTPCCPMDTLNACGAILPFATMACLTATPGVADPRCPNLPVTGVTLNGCCRPNGMCGLDLALISLGCNDPALLGGAPAGRCGGDGG